MAKNDGLFHSPIKSRHSSGPRQLIDVGEGVR